MIRGPQLRLSRRKAAILIAVLVCVLVTALLIGCVMQNLASQHRRGADLERKLQSMWMAESGLRRALARLSVDDAYDGERWEITGGSVSRRLPATVIIQVEDVTTDPAQQRIVVEAYYPSTSQRRVLHRIETLVPASRKGESP